MATASSEPSRYVIHDSHALAPQGDLVRIDRELPEDQLQRRVYPAHGGEAPVVKIAAAGLHVDHAVRLGLLAMPPSGRAGLLIRGDDQRTSPCTYTLLRDLPPPS